MVTKAKQFCFGFISQQDMSPTIKVYVLKFICRKFPSLILVYNCMQLFEQIDATASATWKLYQFFIYFFYQSLNYVTENF